MSTSRGNAPGRAAMDVKEAAQEATALLTKAIKQLLENEGTRGSKGGDPSPRMLFPDGIELIYLGFKVGTDINISLALAGKAAPVKGPVVVGTTATDAAEGSVSAA